MSYGGEIVQSTYDYDKSTIGPYTIPYTLSYSAENGVSNVIPMYRLYEEMLQHEGTLAVFNVNNYCIATLYSDRLVQVPIYQNDKTKDLIQLTFRNRIKVPIVQPVGYIKTYQKCLAVTELPNYLLMDFERNLIGLESKMEGTPMVRPPYNLYKVLITEEQAKAVYFDTVKKEPVFIYK